MKFKVSLGDDSYVLDTEHMLIEELKALKRQTGMTPHKFWDALLEDDPDVVQSVLWLGKKRAGEKVKFESLAQIDVGDLRWELVDVPDDDEDEPDGEDPTEPAAPPAEETTTTGTSTSTNSGTDT